MPVTDVPEFLLYHTLGCHLCEDAEAILAPLSARLKVSYRKVDIADDDLLVERYGVRIPVLCHVASSAELGWPFDDGVAFCFMSGVL